jgi:hypothetical protein
MRVVSHRDTIFALYGYDPRGALLSFLKQLSPILDKLTLAYEFFHEKSLSFVAGNDISARTGCGSASNAYPFG